MKRRLPLSSPASPPPTPRRMTDPGECLPASARPTFPGPCVVIGAAGPGAEEDAAALVEAFLVEMRRLGRPPAGVVALETSASAAASPSEAEARGGRFHRLPVPPNERSDAALVLERDWPADGWVLIQGLALSPVRRAWLTVVCHRTTGPLTRYPPAREVVETAELVLWTPATHTLTQGLARAVSARLARPER